MAFTVLLADDEPHISRVVAAKFRSAGIDTAVAADGADALETAQRLRPALIITDLQMPRLSGLQLAQRLREDPRTAGIPLILLTARGHVLDDAEAARAGIRRVMSKPFSVRELLRTAQEILGAPAPLAADAPGGLAA